MRIFDICLVVISLPIVIPIIIFVSMLLLITQGKPIFFRQKRVGKDFKEFNIFKFRTMYSKNTSKSNFEPGDRSRVTPLGRILRKTKIDEIPQLINVLLGDMTLVGPRPEILEWVKVEEEIWKVLLENRPGITDPASIKYFDEEKILSESSDPISTYREIYKDKLSINLEYSRERTICSDIKTIVKTVFKL